MKENLPTIIVTLERKDGTTFELSGYFSDIRLRKTEVPKDLYKVSIRHSDEDWGDPATVERWVMVNHFGDILLDKPLEFPEQDPFYIVKSYKFDDYKTLEIERKD